MKKELQIGTLAAIVATSVAFGGQARELKGEAASPSGMTATVMQVTAKDLAGTDTSIRLNTGQTLTRTALKLGAGKIDVGIVPPGAFNAMKKGVGPYKGNPEQAKKLSTKLRSLYAFISGITHPIVHADSDIKTWEDVRGKRVFIGPPGGAANRQLTGYVRLMAGLEPGKDYEPVKMGWGAAGQSFQDGQFDVFLQPIAKGSATLVQLFLQGKFRMLLSPVGIEKTEAYAAFLKSASAVPASIDPNFYEGVENGDKEIVTYGGTMLAAVNEGMSDDEAYLLTATFWDNLETNKQSIALLKSVAMAPFAGNNMVLHPGAIRYYREKGMTVPEALIAK